MDKTLEQRVKELDEELVNFALRVLKGETTSDKEIEILPEVITLTLNRHPNRY